MRHLSDWAFVVYTEDGDVFTDWSVYDAGADYYYEGTTLGGLPWAVLSAYDKVGLTCPLIVEPDLARLSGLDNQREESA